MTRHPAWLATEVGKNGEKNPGRPAGGRGGGIGPTTLDVKRGERPGWLGAARICELGFVTWILERPLDGARETTEGIRADKRGEGAQNLQRLRLRTQNFCESAGRAFQPDEETEAAVEKILPRRPANRFSLSAKVRLHDQKRAGVVRA